MPRPRRFRRVRFQPGVTYFKPAGIRMVDLDEVILAVDEYEAVRLKDLECLDQDAAAKKMNISQPTFHRLLTDARKKISNALVNGKAIRIEGGNYKMVQSIQPGRGAGRGAGRGLGRMGGTAAGQVGKCKCPKCDYEQEHVRGQPCVKTKCPKCGNMMIRGD